MVGHLIKPHPCAEHCWHDVGTGAPGPGAAWRERCCQCGRVRAVRRHLEADPAHGPHVTVLRWVDDPAPEPA